MTAKTRRTLAALGLWGIEAEERAHGRYVRQLGENETTTTVEYVDESRPWLRMISVLPRDAEGQLS